MTDTNPPFSSGLAPRKLYITNKHGARVRLEHTRVCDICPYGDNKTCAKCCFNAVNMLGIKAGFSPKEAYREAHKDDIQNSPLMQQLAKRKPFDLAGPNNSVLPRVHMPFLPVASYNQLADRVKMVRRRLG